MRAVLSKRSRSAEGLSPTEVPKPVPGRGELLVEVRATTVTQGDVVLRKMPKLVVRLVGETPKSISGHEFAGEIQAVGADVAGFAAGDRVFGTTTGLKQGSHAEYVAVPADGIVAGIPDGVGFEVAAPVPVGAMTALHFLREAGLGAGERVLVNGASGGVGTYAVQIAKHLGAHVTGVSGGSNTDLVAALGADEVIDYRSTDFTKAAGRYDVIFDVAGKSSEKESRRALTEGGRFTSTRTRRSETVEELLAVRDLLAEGSIEAVVDRSFALEEIADAYRHVENGHKRGNVVVVVE